MTDPARHYVFSCPICGCKELIIADVVTRLAKDVLHLTGPGGCRLSSRRLLHVGELRSQKLSCSNCSWMQEIQNAQFFADENPGILLPVPKITS